MSIGPPETGRQLIGVNDADSRIGMAMAKALRLNDAPHGAIEASLVLFDP